MSETEQIVIEDDGDYVAIQRNTKFMQIVAGYEKGSMTMAELPIRKAIELHKGMGEMLGVNDPSRDTLLTACNLAFNELDAIATNVDAHVRQGVAYKALKKELK